MHPDGTRWNQAQPSGLFFANPGSYPVDDRGVSYSMAFFSPKHSGAGSFYLMAIKDHDGLPLAGTGTYRLTVPPGAPVTQYWSATAYNRATHALIRNMPRSSRSSQSPDLTANADGSTDIYFARTAPPGSRATGCRPAATAASRCCSASTARNRRCSTRPGSYPTSPR